MRRADREVTDRQEILAILNQCTVGHLALVDPYGEPYLVPMNFGWEDKEGKVQIYLHSAKEGRKLDILAKNPRACFEADCNHELETARNACAYSFKYESVMGWGNVRVVQDVEEKIHGLTLLMTHQTGKDFTFEPKHTAIVEVLCLELDKITGKRRLTK